MPCAGNVPRSMCSRKLGPAVDRAERVGRLAHLCSSSSSVRSRLTASPARTCASNVARSVPKCPAGRVRLVAWYDATFVQTGRSPALWALVGFLVTFALVRTITRRIHARQAARRRGLRAGQGRLHRWRPRAPPGVGHPAGARLRAARRSGSGPSRRGSTSSRCCSAPAPPSRSTSSRSGSTWTTSTGRPRDASRSTRSWSGPPWAARSCSGSPPSAAPTSTNAARVAVLDPRRHAPGVRPGLRPQGQARDRDPGRRRADARLDRRRATGEAGLLLGSSPVPREEARTVATSVRPGVPGPARPPARPARRDPGRRSRRVPARRQVRSTVPRAPRLSCSLLVGHSLTTS